MKKLSNTFRPVILAAVSLFILGGCGSANEKSAGPDSTVQAPPEAVAPPQVQKLTDAEIASIAVTANQIDIDYAKIALKKATNAEVKKFAATMAKDHQAVIDKAVALAKKLGVTPKDNATTQSLLKGETDMKSAFDSKTGADFDKVYIDNEVEFHKASISLVEGTLIKDATNEELKALLQSALPLFKEHLQHAEMVQKAVVK